MGTLAEIEAAVDALPDGEKQQLLLYLAARLRSDRGRTPPPRTFQPGQVDSWVKEDEAAMRRLRGEQGSNGSAA